MEIQEDFKEFFALLNVHKVDFIIVGGYALAFHGAPRYTGDIDVYIKVVQLLFCKIIWSQLFFLFQLNFLQQQNRA